MVCKLLKALLACSFAHCYTHKNNMDFGQAADANCYTRNPARLSLQ